MFDEIEEELKRLLYWTEGHYEDFYDISQDVYSRKIPKESSNPKSDGFLKRNSLIIRGRYL